MRAPALAVVACALACAAPTHAQGSRVRTVSPPTHVAPPPAHDSPPPVLSDDPKDLRARFGLPVATRLILSSDPDERLRGLERAEALGGADAIGLLARARDGALGRSDGRSEVAIARGLAMHADDPAARTALVAIVEPPAAARVAHDDDGRDPERAVRVEMARSIAALALAQSGDAAKLEKLAAIARGTGVGAAAAEGALVAFPASLAMTSERLTPRAMHLLARMGDRRTAGALLEAARSRDLETRASAIESLAELGDARVLDVARAVKSEDDPRLRMAAATAFVALGAPEAAGAVEQLLADDLTAGRGLALAAGTHGPGLVRALAAQASVTTDHAVRAEAIEALGRDPTAEGIEALVALARDGTVRAESLGAIARSPSPDAMRAIETLATDAGSRRSAVRAYVVRARVRGERSSAVERVTGELARSQDPRDRALGVFARVALGEDTATKGLEDGDPLVRRAAAMAVPSTRWTPDVRDALLAQREREHDPATRTVLATALGFDPPEREVASTESLLACAEGGGADAPLCTLAFARRAGATNEAQLTQLLASQDAILRAHAARGLALGNDPTRSGRLAEAYRYETAPLVRRAIVAGLARSPRTVPSVASVLAFAARLDPDATVRWIASRVLANEPVADERDVTDVAWLRLVDAAGSPPPAGATGALLRADGLAIPVVFDSDGDALVPGTPAGQARLVLAPQLGAAYAPSP